MRELPAPVHPQARFQVTREPELLDRCSLASRPVNEDTADAGWRGRRGRPSTRQRSRGADDVHALRGSRCRTRGSHPCRSSRARRRSRGRRCASRCCPSGSCRPRGRCCPRRGRSRRRGSRWRRCGRGGCRRSRTARRRGRARLPFARARFAPIRLSWRSKNRKPVSFFAAMLRTTRTRWAEPTTMPNCSLPRARFATTTAESDAPLTSAPLFPLRSSALCAIRLPAEPSSTSPFQLFLTRRLRPTTEPGEFRTSTPSDWKAFTSFDTSFPITRLRGESEIAMPADTGSPSTPPSPIRRTVTPRTRLPLPPRIPTPLIRKSVMRPPTMRTFLWPSLAMPSPPAAFVPEIVWPAEVDGDPVRADDQPRPRAVHEIRREGRARGQCRSAGDGRRRRGVRPAHRDEQPQPGDERQPRDARDAHLDPSSVSVVVVPGRPSQEAATGPLPLAYRPSPGGTVAAWNSSSASSARSR